MVVESRQGAPTERVGRPGFCARRSCHACAPAGAGAEAARQAGASGAKKPRSAAVAVVCAEPNIQRTIERIFTTSIEFHSCGFFATAAEALRAIPGLRVDIVLVALALPDHCGIQCARELRALKPGLKTILIASLPDSVLLGEAMAAGIDHCLIWPFRSGRCLETLRLVASRPARAASYAADRLSSTTGLHDPARLTERENQVLRLLAEGLEYKQIEDRLSISHSAMRRAQRSFCDKLHALNSIAAVVNWLRLRPPPDH